MGALAPPGNFLKVPPFRPDPSESRQNQNFEGKCKICKQRNAENPVLSHVFTAHLSTRQYSCTLRCMATRICCITRPVSSQLKSNETGYVPSASPVVRIKEGIMVHQILVSLTLAVSVHLQNNAYISS